MTYNYMGDETVAKVNIEIGRYNSNMAAVCFYRTSSYASAVLGVVILSVCVSVRPSVRHTRVLCDKTKQLTHCGYFDTIRNGKHSSRLTPTVAGG